MDPNKRPDDMVRITTPELANAFIDEQVDAIRAQVGDKKVLLALSGGVDSSVVAALLIKAIGKQLICVHVNPDILESDGVKAHHNVGGLPDDLQFELCEPVKLLYKDEVRVIGRELGLPEEMVERQPFPGPGLGVRCLGAITRDRLEALRAADAILREEFAAAGLEGKVWQYFVSVPDFRATGVRDGVRAFEWPAIIRAVNTVDAMTAEVPELDWTLLKKITARILAEVPGICRVVYDLTPKPIGTIEWE